MEKANNYCNTATISCFKTDDSLSGCTIGTFNNSSQLNKVCVSKGYFKNHYLPGDVRYLEDDGKYNYEVKEVHITRVVYSNPATIAFWSDGTKTVSKCHKGDPYVPDTGLALCILKKMCGNTKVREILDTWVPTNVATLGIPSVQTLKDVRIQERKNY